MKKYITVIWLLMTLLLTACGKQDREADTKHLPPDAPLALESVSIDLQPVGDTATTISESEISESEQAITNIQVDFAEDKKDDELEFATPSPTETPRQNNGLIVVIDAGHQRRGNSTLEPIGFGATEMKAKVTGGTSGVVTKIPEYELTLTVSFLLRDELIERGYEVYLTRETHDLDISNRERAEFATKAEADVFIRIHANGDANAATNGIMTISPTRNNPYVPELYAQSRALSDAILEEMLAATGANSKGVWETDTMSGINWATMPVTIVEMGYMSNTEEDKLLQDLEYQLKLVEGMANGIDLFFNPPEGHTGSN